MGLLLQGSSRQREPSDTDVGELVISATDHTPVTQLIFAGGDQSKSVTFDPLTSGTTTIALTAPPPGFVAATTQQDITATVTAPNITKRPLSA